MKSILVFRSAALGDFIISCPALEEVRRSFPEHHIVLLTIQSANRLQREKVSQYVGGSHHMPWLELAIPHLIDEIVTLGSLIDLAYMLTLRRQLKNLHIDKAIMMLDPWSPWLGRLKKLALVRFLVGMIPILGWRGGSASKLSVENALQLKKQGMLKHHVHGPLQFLAEMNPPRKYRDEDLIFDLRPGEAAIDWISGWLRDRALEDGVRLVAVAPGSIQPHKRWPLESFEELICSILERYADVHIVVIGTPSDKTLGSVLVTVEPKRIHNLAGVTTIAQSAALLQQCVLLVGNDGGAMHLGDAMGCKVVSIVPGIEYPDSIEPWHNKSLAIRHSLECSPCYNFIECPQGHNRCMKDLPVRIVLERCFEVLESA